MVIISYNILVQNILFTYFKSIFGGHFRKYKKNLSKFNKKETGRTAKGNLK